MCVIPFRRYTFAASGVVHPMHLYPILRQVSYMHIFPPDKRKQNHSLHWIGVLIWQSNCWSQSSHATASSDGNCWSRSSHATAPTSGNAGGSCLIPLNLLGLAVASVEVRRQFILFKSLVLTLACHFYCHTES